MSIAFKLVSLNARGIRTFEKRKAIFEWLMKQQAGIFFFSYKKRIAL